MTITPEMIQALLTFIVGGGLITLVTQVVRGSRSLRAGARASTREIVKDLAAARDEAEDRLARVRQDRDYWRSVAGDYGYQLRSHGHVPIPESPRSPSEREAEKPARTSARRRRADAAPTTQEIRRAAEED